MKFYKISFFLFLNNIFSKTDSSKFGKSECYICTCSIKDDKIIKKEEEIIKEKTVKDLDLDKNITETFIKNNKERVFKMIKVFNKDLKYEDIDEILILLYNLVSNDKFIFNDKEIIIKHLYSKFVKNKDKVLYLLYSNKIFYVFTINREDFNVQSLFFGKQFYYYNFESFNNNKDTYSREFDITENEKNIVIKVLFDYFYRYNIENNNPFPLKFIGIIADYLYFEKEKKEKLKVNLERNKYYQILLEDNLYLEKPVYFYLNEKFKECYEVKNEKQFRVLTDNIEQIILKINNDKVEFFKY